jgi:TonB family protein
MAGRRSLARLWRRLRRPTLGRLVCVSLLVHVGVGLGLVAWLTRPSGRPAPSRAPLIVELPPAAPGPPLVKPEAPRVAPARPGLPPVVAGGRPAPSRPEAAPPPPLPVPSTPPPPPAVARAPEPSPPPARPVPPEPAPPPPEAARTPSPSTPPEPAREVARATPTAPAGPSPAEPAPPAVAARPPGTGEEAGRPAPPSPPPAAGAPSPGGAELPWAGRRYSLLAPGLDVPLPAPPSGRGGTRPEGAGAGESGTELEGQVAVPLNTPDPRYAAYFAELKRRIEEKWVYPQEAARRGQSGQGELRFVLRKDGSVRTVEIVQSAGVAVLDRYIENAIRLASPFPPIPASVGEDAIPISLNYTYVLGGFRVFGFR